MYITGYISDFDGETLTILAPFSDVQLLTKQEITECEIRLDDGRTISADQRKKIYATFNDIADWTGYTADQLKAIMKYEYIAKTGCHYFSLSDTDMSTARDFLSFLIEFCIEHEIPCKDSLLDRSPDIARYIYFCLAKKVCAVCGKKADLHHVDTVGQGRNRKEIDHIGMRALPLCRIHHNECHNIGKSAFESKYKLFGVKIDAYLAKIHKLGGRIND
ncbi:MAG: putative HNHc nuclease [Oscillospiraceae bacterium]|jgi:hypothetical protein